ncbi:MAG: ABC transporter ATP-binding protein [Candidatus Omnitrophota bacterium]
MEKVILSVKNLSCGYGSRTILRDVSFEVGTGEFIGIIGPNGSGKTTLLRAISKAIPLKKESRVVFNGRSIADMSYQELAKETAVVLQSQEDGAFYTTVRENVLLGRIPHFGRFQWVEGKNDHDIAEESMRLLDIAALGDRSVNEISGGERQRASIARALAQKPRLLIMDEPVAHLDINHRIEIFGLLKRLIKEGGITVICALHDLNLASKYCARIILLSEGRIARQGSPRDIITEENIKNVYKAETKIYRGSDGGNPQIVY